MAQTQYDKKKVCIFDWDVHVGNGTSSIFYEDDTVLYISIHRSDQGNFYPGKNQSHEMTGKDKGRGFNIHFPFDKPFYYSEELMVTQNIGDNDYIYVCEELLFPIIKQFDPDLIIISAGFDSAKGDPLGGIGVSPVGFAWMTQGLRMI